jgi:hypothetical protein
MTRTNIRIIAGIFMVAFRAAVKAVVEGFIGAADPLDNPLKSQ